MSAGLAVEAVGPAHLVRWGEVVVLVDPGDGCAAAWGGRPGPDAVLVTCGGKGAGLYALLERLAAGGRAAPLAVHCGPADEVTTALIAAWIQVGRGGFEVSVEVAMPDGPPEVAGGLIFGAVSTGGRGVGWMVVAPGAGARGESALFLDPGAGRRGAALGEGADVVVQGGQP